MYISANQLYELLRRNVLEVTFTKVNGDQRVMNCTLKPDFIGEEYSDRNKHPISETGSAMSVWDTEANDWRAFRLDSIKSVRINGELYVPTGPVLLC